MKKLSVIPIALLLFILCIATPVWAQKMQDVVYLKNESIIRGTILRYDSLKIKIETCCNSVFVFPSDEVLKIEKESPPPSDRGVKEKGYLNLTSAGSLVGPGNNEKAAPFSLMIEHDYRINRYFMAGLVLGYEQLNESVMPLGGSIRGLLPFRQNLIFAGGTAGYMISLENPDDYLFTEASGGFYINPEVGIILPFSDNGGVVLAVGYRYGKLNYLRDYWWEGDIKRTVHYNRLSVRLGISLY